mmetsp:Transcript_40471/g.114448  ORF Transcript_40471/g.114448 Transcript_40471/m.114448 type:complete len:88 (+) Transcript_40471:66-329(+)
MARRSVLATLFLTALSWRFHVAAVSVPGAGKCADMASCPGLGVEQDASSFLLTRKLDDKEADAPQAVSKRATGRGKRSKQGKAAPLP